jgi:hypothetical protein
MIFYCRPISEYVYDLVNIDISKNCWGNMKKIRRFLSKSALATFALTGLVVSILGCESGTTDSKEIVVSPTIINIPSTKGNGVFFVANRAVGSTLTESSSTTTNNNTTTTSTTVSSGTTNQTLFYPLQWSVSTPSIGFIRSASGNTAIYESLGGKGNNIIKVRDQDDNTGQAVVVQE